VKTFADRFFKKTILLIKTTITHFTEVLSFIAIISIEEDGAEHLGQQKCSGTLTTLFLRRQIGFSGLPCVDW